MNEQEVAAKWAAAREADARERTAVNEAVPPKGTAVNDYSALVICDANGTRYVFPSAYWTIEAGVLEVRSNRHHVASFRQWVSVVRVDSEELAQEHLHAATMHQAFTEEPPPRPRMRANMAPREEG